MAPWTHLWTVVLRALSFSTIDDYAASQHPIGNKHHELEGGISPEHPEPQSGYFSPPGSNIPGFQCNYTRMHGWRPCQTPTDKTCWLSKTGSTPFDIWTDYEKFVPIGTDRYYTLEVTNGTLNVDGMNFTEAKLFNGSYPGPLIEACWGDTVHITVINKLPYNGTSVHWHGIRQNQTMHMDGVNGITQCPIAPGDSFTYIWNATQYGTSWYHSHYSVQYADGAHAPITIHGPSISNYDVAIEPLIMTDWMHNSAFEVIYTNTPSYPSIVLNGAGNLNKFNKTSPVNPKDVPPPYEISFEPANTKTGQYLIRLSNTAFGQGFVFSIDNHILQIVEADFVPVKPFFKDSLLVAIGQRYNIIVESKPLASPSGKNPIPSDYNFWLRMWIACEYPRDDSTLGANYSQIGILRYTNSTSKTSDPTSLPWPEIPSKPPCVDDTYSSLVPVVNWTVGSPVNSGGTGNGEEFNISGLLNSIGPYATAFFYLQRSSDNTNPNPFATDYGNPTFLNLANTADTWPIGWMVIPENYTALDWVFLVIQSELATHPMHLHGHDFAIVQESSSPFSPEIFKPNCNNPPRRDVVLVQAKGFVAIAFKTDNPGTWLMHCHIAFHASSGLALQILERQAAANVIWPPLTSHALKEARRVCANWNSWTYDCKNYWPGLIDGVYPACNNLTELQNDSGI